MALGIINILECKLEEIQKMPTETDLEKAVYYEALGNYWHKRDLHYGDGSMIKKECFQKAASYFKKHSDMLDELGRFN